MSCPEVQCGRSKEKPPFFAEAAFVLPPSLNSTFQYISDKSKSHRRYADGSFLLNAYQAIADNAKIDCGDHSNQ